MKLIFSSFTIALVVLVTTLTYAQTADTTKRAGAQATAASAPAPTPEKKPANSLTIGVDMRVRSELRHGYRVLPTADTTAAFFANQRTRINFDYRSKPLDVYLSLQDTRIWGQQDPRTPTLPLYFFEAYAEPHFSSKFSARIGRQRIIYDNQRLFAENDWRLTAASHDAFRFIYNNKINLTTELVLAYNQSTENNFTSNYKPVDIAGRSFPNYKNLIVHYINWKISDKATLTTINAEDGYQNPKSYGVTYARYTSGGRLEYSTYDWYFTASGYYQYGKDSSGRKLNAYYFQPEIKYSGIKGLSVRLGMEYFSGHDGTKPVTEDNNFVPLYGVAHRFNGNIDFFTAFPTDLNNAGLVNPYLFFQYQKDKWTFRFENHLFYSQNNFVYKGAVIDKYLGFETDLRVNFKANSVTDIEVGFAAADPTKSMAIIKKAGNDALIPYWGYMSVKFTPTIGKFTF